MHGKVQVVTYREEFERLYIARKNRSDKEIEEDRFKLASLSHIRLSAHLTSEIPRDA